MVIVGGGAAGFAAAEMLRRDGFPGSVVLLSADAPNCSKDYLAGNAPEDWMALRPPEFYQDQSIELQLNTEVTGIDTKAQHATLSDGRRVPFDKLLLATGSEPARLDRRRSSSSLALAQRPSGYHRQSTIGAVRCCARRQLHRA